MSKITVAIPTHDMVNKDFFLRRCLDSLWNQTFQDFDIVVTDNSENSVIEDICAYYGGIKYYQNPNKGMAQNTNEAIKRSDGSLIKILYMDDYLAHPNALQEIWSNFKGQWLVTGCTHSMNGGKTFNNHTPRFSMDIKNGINTIGSPSVLTIKNEMPLFFDEKMTWLLDCDYYKRLYSSKGAPTILDDINVVIGIHEGQATHLLSDELKANESEYLIAKNV